MAEYPPAARRVLKATYDTQLPVEVQRDAQGAAALKYGYVSQLTLQPGEVAAVRASLAASDPLHANRKIWGLLSPFEGTLLPSQPPAIAAFAKTPVTDLLAFGQALAKLRQAAVLQPVGASAAVAPSPGQTQPRGKVRGSAAPVTAIAQAGPGDTSLQAQSLLNSVKMANAGLQQNTNATPIGMLHLETLEMIPAGIERGELIATIPLAPLEETAVAQKEWSVTSEEFTSIVTDSLENYSETGVTENTELAQSTTSQAQHSSQFNVNGTLSGNFALVTLTAASGFQTQDQTSNSATASTKHAMATTKKASSRVKQSHKVTISTTTVTGTSESTTRTLKNSSATNPMRVDYFSMMRKWHVGLYRYGARLTYDIVIPEPGSSLRQVYRQLADLQNQAAQGFVFNLPYSEITIDPVDGNGHPWIQGTSTGTPVPKWEWLANHYDAPVPAPPDPPAPMTLGAPSLTRPGGGWQSYDMQFQVLDGCWITGLRIILHMQQNNGGVLLRYAIDGGYYSDTNNPGGVQGGLYTTDPPFAGQTGRIDLDPNYLFHATGTQTISFYLQDVGYAHATVFVYTEVTPAAIQQWQASVWNALYNAAQTSFYANQQQVQTQIQQLQDRINNVDTLTLRREEHDEIMKGVLRWLLGPGFQFMNPMLELSFIMPAPPTLQSPVDVNWGSANPLFPQNEFPLFPTGMWTPVGSYEQMVRFINDAIDWDNLIYFLYSYFWGIPSAWDNVRQIQHPDAIRQAFLRAGSARVVLTVRKGWEIAWVNFVEFGVGDFLFGGAQPQHPYLSIAQEIQDYDNTSYPGIPPANPAGVTAPDDGYYASTTCSDSVHPSTAPVTLTVVSNVGFKVGYTAIIDSWNHSSYVASKGGVQEIQVIIALPPDPKDTTHITVQGLKYPHDGSKTPFPIILGSEKGILVAEWYEYTPSSGTDIAVTTPTDPDAVPSNTPRVP